MNPGQSNFRLQKIVTVVAVLLFIVKIIAWWLTHSVAVLTDALESVVNVIAGFISLYSLYVAAKPRDIDHPYGHGKAEFIAAAIEGVMITMAGCVIIVESVAGLMHPKTLHQLDWGILLIAFTAVVNFIIGWACIKTGKKNNSLALIASGKHLQSDTYSTIGIVIGLMLIYFTHFNLLDNFVAIGFAFYIMYTGYTIIRSSLEGIMDKADTELLSKMVKVLYAHKKDNWIDLHNIRIIKFGSVLHLDAHLTLPWYLNVHESHNEIETISALVKNEFGESMELFVHADGCLDFSCKICHKKDCPVRLYPLERTIVWDVDNTINNEKHGS